MLWCWLIWYIISFRVTELKLFYCYSTIYNSQFFFFGCEFAILNKILCLVWQIQFFDYLVIFSKLIGFDELFTDFWAFPVGICFFFLRLNKKLELHSNCHVFHKINDRYNIVSTCPQISYFTSSIDGKPFRGYFMDFQDILTTHFINTIRPVERFFCAASMRKFERTENSFVILWILKFCNWKQQQQQKKNILR